MIINTIINKIKTNAKRKMFEKNAICGKNLCLSSLSFCATPSKESVTIGDNCELSCRISVTGDGKLSIGNNTTVRYDSKISCAQNIKIGNCVIISNNVRIYDHNSHPTDPKIREEMCMNGFHGDAWLPKHAAKKTVVIDDNVWIGEHSVILKGVHIGKGSVVGCNSVVTKDVPPYTIVAGNPAVIVKEIGGYSK